MADNNSGLLKKTLDKDLGKIAEMEVATVSLSRRYVGVGIGFLFLALSTIFAGIAVSGQPGFLVITAAAAVGAYMAMNIGANDVANNVGPAVGSRALSMTGALVIAAICESAGALIAGGDVVATISKGIINPEAVAVPSVFIAAMMAALFSSALWVNLATWIGAPVSTTHSVVGGVMGAGIAAAGFSAVQWDVMAAIAASWVVSPVLGGVVAALFLAFVKTFVIYQEDKIAAARKWVPLLIALMASAFAVYLAMKGLKQVVKISGFGLLVIAVSSFLATWVFMRPLIHRQSVGMENRNQSLRRLFNIPLVFSAALLSFAHGANDVANAVGPLAAIVHTAEFGDVSAKVSIPIWIMVIGALGISVGLLIFGPRLIRMVGEKITKLNPIRAYCVALSAAITVIIASWLGLPVSSTHIAVGAVFGVGFFREWYTVNSSRRRDYMARKYARLRNANQATPVEAVWESAEEEDDSTPAAREESARRRLVRRAHVRTIVAAWLITVPAAALLAALIFALLRLAA
ncbi:MAG: inorganic phosphate transporter [Rhizobiaceae bacterium]